jgi:hypothetical protein
MGLTRVYLMDQSWRRADRHEATVTRVYIGPGPHYTMVPAVFVNGEAVADDDLRGRLLQKGYVRLTPP